MTYLEIDKAIIDITRQKCTECKARLEAIPKESITERKALQLEYGMYTFCGNAGLLFNTTGDRSKTIQIRQRFLNNEIHKYSKLDKIYQTIDDEEKLRFIAALQAEMYIRDQWLNSQRAELAEAESSSDVEKVFEIKIKIGAVENMFSAWEAWRKENGIYPAMFEED